MGECCEMGSLRTVLCRKSGYLLVLVGQDCGQ